MRKKKEDRHDSPEAPETEEKHTVKSAFEIGLERAAQMNDEPIEIETEEGTVSMTFDELKEKALQADEYLTALQYKQAEFENYRKRTLKEREDLLKETVRLTEILEILDPLERALEIQGNEASIREGIQLIHRQLENLLERKGVERVPGFGEPFDPEHHEAIAEQPHEEIPVGHVAVEYQRGFRIGDRVLRPGKVVVSSGPAD